ncbi:riboflavin synthase, alpha subunit [Gluconacetobacter diazotrophicus PA1 5]|uniref:Riboflavin synthase n=2 Tax=Gluconacetobacter diazotrophicus TaxID=33996 RepID=A9HDG0_GLUDA|nr:riboflavin synthase [Gluconacetobacter diazotrophicus]ACI51626.1 riboflavin synthase, alpha subunit [Gluconacetobacter diazotrophicus PA1 5]MBB2155340.1 riboflavin synthase [Gluconacetobacter diazotrophicus]TWB02831.1 riboflavin synthase alpha chain [Gluconacetobacter diazotrophicus]CAP55096.1 Riboflavin synthase alpha chain [Gluconacetobacter diazotrophicus PA1 5]
MFSGIIEHLGTVTAARRGDRSLHVAVATGIGDLSMGESIAVNGVCLTVTAYDAAGNASFFISSETLERTSLGRLAEGSRVNLERAVTPATRLSGHIVQGHVDGTARLLSVEDAGESRRIVFGIPAALRRYLVEKGSITLDGISLTLNEIGEVGTGAGGAEEFPVALMIIPHTWTHTTLGTLSPGDGVNVEVDVIAKYVETLCQYR